MALYRMYVDECGDHNMSSDAETEQQRYLSLTGIWIQRDEVINHIRPEMEQLKRTHFEYDRDEPLILHRNDIVRKSGRFHVLRSPDRRERFDNDLLDCLSRWQFGVVTVVLDKKTHSEKGYRQLKHPYHYCLHVLIERYRGANQRHGGDVMAEARGGKEDMALKKEYGRIWRLGTSFISSQAMQSFLTSREIKVKQKQMNIEGLQIADLIAQPTRLEILRPEWDGNIYPGPFGDRIIKAIGSKWSRRYNAVVLS